MKKQLEDGINLIAEIIGENKISEEQSKRIFELLGTLQGLLILESLK